MNIEVRARDRAQQSKLSIIDCDFHPRLTHEQLKPFISNQWWSYLQTYGHRQRHGQAKSYNYPKIVPQASRCDSWPPSGGPPGSDVDFCREQHLDFDGIDYGILTEADPIKQPQAFAAWRDYFLDQQWAMVVTSKRPRVATSAAVHGIGYTRAEKLYYDETWLA